MPAEAEARVPGISGGVRALWAGGVTHRTVTDEAAEGDRRAALAARRAVQILVGHEQMLALLASTAIGMSAHRGYAILRSLDRAA
jgi:hypothetical protein